MHQELKMEEQEEVSYGFLLLTTLTCTIQKSLQREPLDKELTQMI